MLLYCATCAQILPTTCWAVSTNPSKCDWTNRQAKSTSYVTTIVMASPTGQSLSKCK